MSEEIRITVPLTPPSVNQYVRHARTGRHYVTAAAKAYKAALAIFARSQQIRAGAYEVSYAVYLGKGQRLDADNTGKCVLDGLKDAGVIHSDAAVKALHITEFRDWDNPRTEITIRPMKVTR